MYRVFFSPFFRKINAKIIAKNLGNGNLLGPIFILPNCSTKGFKTKAKAIEIIPVQLHAGMQVIVEGAADHVAPVDLAAVVLGGLLHSDSRFYSFKQIHRLCPPSFIDGICPSA